MAKISGIVHITGTIGNLTIYKMNGKYYARSKSSLTGKQFKKDPAFEKARHNAALLGQGAQLAAKIYKLLPKDKCKHGVIGKLTALATRLLKEGMKSEKILSKLKEEWLPVKQPLPQTKQIKHALSKAALRVNQKGVLQQYIKVNCKPIYYNACVGNYSISNDFNGALKFSDWFMNVGVFSKGFL